MPSKNRTLLWRLLKILAAFAVISVMVMAVFPHRLLVVDSGEVKGNAIVVLGGALDRRPEWAAELYKRGDAPRILVSGIDDTPVLTRRLEKNGVPASLITQEPYSRTTFENAEFCAPLLRQMGAHRVIIVTSWYHSRRALALFRHVAPDITFYSRPSYFGYEPQEWDREDLGRHIAAEYPKTLRCWIWYGVWPYSL